MQLKHEKWLFIIGLDFSKLRDHNIQRCEISKHLKLYNRVQKRKETFIDASHIINVCYLMVCNNLINVLFFFLSFKFKPLI